MASEWEETTLGDEVDLLTGFPFKSERYTDADDSIRLVRGDNIVQGALRWDGVKRWPASGSAEHELYQLREGDVVLAMDRPWIEAGLKYAAISKYDLPCFLVQRTARLRGSAKLENRFLRYLIGSQEFTQHIHAITTGTAVPHISGRQIKDFAFLLPPIAEQRAIAHILGTLDDKIELNRRMSETLEAMARALFKSWFVDFDPVRAKMEGRWQRGQSLPGLPAHLYDLFPDRLVDSALGEIPEGWEMAPLPEVIDVNPARALRKGVEAPYLDMANMPTHGHSADDVVDRAFGSGMRFVNGDTLVARITPCLENGKTAFVDFLQDGQVGWGSTEYIVLRPKPPLPVEFAYCLARSAEFRDFAIQSMTGTSGRQRVPAESLAHFRVAVPPLLLAESFGRAVKPRFARASAAVRESRALAAVRDALLPTLISGEVRIKGSRELLKESTE